MKATIRERLAQVSARYEEVGLLLSDPEVFSNANRYRDLSREYAQLEPLVKSWRHWRENDAAISEARQMLDEQDSELREMAAEELEAGEHGGFKEIVVRIAGQGAYSRFKFESGTHRVQRVPETESQGRIHTSACTVAILPEVEDVEAVEINPSDLRVDTFRASGAGGQHVNKTDSAIRLTHIPSGIVVQCQNDRSQHKNKATAMKQLKSKLYELEMHKRRSDQQVVEDSKSDIGWGSQIRSYVLDQSRIKDLRTGVETGNTQAVLDGDLDDFIEASLKSGL